MKNIINYIFLIVVSLILTTIASCSSVKKNKTVTKIEEQIKEKSNTDIKSNVDSTYTKSDFKITSAEKEGLVIDYQPIFKDGVLVPFSFVKKDVDGRETNISITGNATVKYFTESQVDNMINNLQEQFSKEIDSVANINKNIDYSLIKKDKDKEVKPDYIKYIIWFAVIIILLSAVILIVYFYFRSQIKSLTKFLPKNE